jgi:hypothetical protein
MQISGDHAGVTINVTYELFVVRKSVIRSIYILTSSTKHINSFALGDVILGFRQCHLLNCLETNFEETIVRSKIVNMKNFPSSIF